MNKILIVDDSEINRAILSNIFSGDFEVEEAENGQQALAYLQEHYQELSVILLDLIMPVMDGHQLLNEMKKREMTGKVPVVCITADQNEENEREMFDAGVSDLIRKPFQADIVHKRVQNIVDLHLYKNYLEDQVEKQTSLVKAQNKKLHQLNDQLRQINVRIVDTMCSVIEFRSLESGNHVRRIKEYTNTLCSYIKDHCPEYNLTDDDVKLITQTSALHDVGKIMIPDSILSKPGKLTDEEFEIMKTHTVKGCEVIDMMAEVQSKEYRQLAYDICRHHHERWDGRGYPDHQKGDEISIAAQIVSIADVYDALVNDRCYRKALPFDVAYQMIMDGKCGTFSPRLLECFTGVRPLFEAIHLRSLKEQW